ncbi:MAG TPA: tetratricopeptide repeat protein [Trichormus sp.]
MYTKQSPVRLSSLIAGLCIVASASPASAFLGFYEPPTSQSEQIKKQQDALKPPPDEPTLNLVDQISRQPELMNLQYLDYVLGRPTSGGPGVGMLRRYYWYDPVSERLRFQLEQKMSGPNHIYESTFTAFMPNLKTDLEEIESKNGPAPKKFFDQSAAPNITYSFAPYTTVDYTQPQDAFCINKAIVTFHTAGTDFLPPLQQETLDEAIEQHRMQALAHHQNGNFHRAIPDLRRRVAEHPDDIEARIALAEAYKGNSNINEAITEYRAALAQAPDSQTAQKCIQGLQDMRVLPGPDGPAEQHQLTISRDGQGFKETSDTNQGSPVPMPAESPTAALPPNGLNIEPLDPPSVMPGYHMDPQAGF